MSVKRLGIIGGVGHLAAAHFHTRLISLAEVTRDEEHLPVVLVADPIPSRIDHLKGVAPSPLPALLGAVATLTRAGVDAIAIPSATTHAYRPQIVAALNAPVLVMDLLAEATNALARCGISDPVILATAPTVALRLYDAYLPDEVRAHYPGERIQTQVDGIVDGVKRGRELPALKQRLAKLVLDAPWPIGTDAVLLGCTELSVVTPASNVGRLPLFDVTDILATAALRLRRPAGLGGTATPRMPGPGGDVR